MLALHSHLIEYTVNQPKQVPWGALWQPPQKWFIGTLLDLQ
jgi:hypothetical protein